VRENDEVVDGDGAREDTGACLVGCREGGEAHDAERGARGGVVRRGDRCTARVRGALTTSSEWPWAVLGARCLTRAGFLSGDGGHRRV
jgi:hypothetical protein